jgi:hypothetical protein
MLTPCGVLMESTWSSPQGLHQDSLWTGSAVAYLNMRKKILILLCTMGLYLHIVAEFQFSDFISSSNPPGVFWDLIG